MDRIPLRIKIGIPHRLDRFRDYLIPGFRASESLSRTTGPVRLFRCWARLKVKFCTKALEIAIDRRDRQFPAVSAEGYGAIALRKASIDLSRVPSFRVTHIADAEVILHRPKERHGIEYLAATKYVARGGLSLTSGYDKVLDSDAFAGHPVRPARDIAGRENPRGTRFKIFVDHYAAIDTKPRPFRQ